MTVSSDHYAHFFSGQSNCQKFDLDHWGRGSLTYSAFKNKTGKSYNNDVRWRVTHTHTALFCGYWRQLWMSLTLDKPTVNTGCMCWVAKKSCDGCLQAKEMAPGTEIDGRKIRVDYSITERAHTPTPGVYLGRPSGWFWLFLWENLQLHLRTIRAVHIIVLSIPLWENISWHQDVYVKFIDAVQAVGLWVRYFGIYLIC